jgi:C1A family cysteine protease
MDRTLPDNRDMSTRKRLYGWRRQIPDFRDKTHYHKTSGKLPSKIDLRRSFAEPYDQGQLGSCTANAICALWQYRRKQEKKPAWMPSRLYLYFFERSLEHTAIYDSGAQIRDGMKVLNSQGVCPEKEWPYDISKFAVYPPVKCFTDVTKFESRKYATLDNTNGESLLTALAERNPFVFGFTVYESFESPEVAKTGIVPMPSKSEKALGGHAVVAVGFSLATQMFLVRNSWGVNWGLKGYFWMPFSYLTNPNLASDFWTLSLVE